MQVKKDSLLYLYLIKNESMSSERINADLVVAEQVSGIYVYIYCLGLWFRRRLETTMITLSRYMVGSKARA